MLFCLFTAVQSFITGTWVSWLERSQSVDPRFDSLVESNQKALIVGIHSFPEFLKG